VIAAGLVTALGLAAYVWILGAMSPKPDLPSPQAARQSPAGFVLDDDVFSNDFAWAWPENLRSTASMFQCWPDASKDTAASMMVWTDKANKVVAFGTAREGMPLPAYATVLSRTGTVDASGSVQAASEGHVMLTSKTKNALQGEDLKLTCLRTHDD
jgi:hypothetical protein